MELIKESKFFRIIAFLLVSGMIYLAYDLEMLDQKLQVDQHNRLKIEVERYERENYLNSYNQEITKLLYENIDYVQFHPRKPSFTKDIETLFKSTYELYPSSAEVFYNDFSGHIELYKESPVNWNNGVKGINYIFLDKYAEDLKIEVLEGGNFERFTGAIKTNIEFYIDETSQLIQEIKSVSSTIKVNSVYSQFGGSWSLVSTTAKTSDIPLNYELLTELPSNQIDIKLIQTIEPIHFSDNIFGEIQHKEKTIEKLITIKYPF